MIKSYIIADDHEGVEIVFAESATKAKSAAFGSENLNGGAWINLRAIREKGFDSYADKFGPGLVRWSDVEVQRMARWVGWYEIDGSSDECERCELFVWYDVPESELDADGICQECLHVHGAGDNRRIE